MKPIFYILALFLAGCSNRMVNGQRHGYWKERDTIDGVVYTSKGRYARGLEKGTWTYKQGKTRYKKERYKGKDCRVTMYAANSKITRQGYSRLESNDTLAHWYYTGDWISYDTLGRPASIDTYYKGELVGEREIIH